MTGRPGAGPYEGLIDRGPVALFRVRADGRLLEANPAFARLLGYDTLEALRAALGPGARVLVLAGGEVVVNERRELRHRGGASIPVLVNAVRVAGAAGPEFEGAAIDVGELEQAEEAARQAQMARVTGQLASAVAHEINNPLMVILARAQLLAARHAGDPGLRDQVGAIMDAAYRIREVVVEASRAGRPAAPDLRSRLRELQRAAGSGASESAPARRPDPSEVVAAPR